MKLKGKIDGIVVDVLSANTERLMVKVIEIPKFYVGKHRLGEEFVIRVWPRMLKAWTKLPE